MQAMDKAIVVPSRALMGIDLAIPAANAEKIKVATEKLSAAQLVAVSVVAKYGKGVEDVGNKNYPAYEKAIGSVTTAHQKLMDLQTAHLAIFDALSQRLHGQAADAAQTFSGKLNRYRKGAGDGPGRGVGHKAHPSPRAADDDDHERRDMDSEAPSRRRGAGHRHRRTRRHRHRRLALIGVAAAAFIAENVMTLGLAAAIAGLIVGITLLVTHWHQVWEDITSFVKDHMLIIVGVLALILGPLGLVIAAVLELATHWKTAWGVIQDVLNTAWSVIKPIFNLIKSAGTDYVSNAIMTMVAIWNTAWAIVASVINTAKGAISVAIAVISFAIGGIEAVINGLFNIWETVWGNMAGAVEALWGHIAGIFNDIINGVHSVISAIGGIASAVANAANTSAPSPATLLNPPHRAGGGPVSALMPYIVGENGPELFIPGATGIISPTVNTGATGVPVGVGQAAAGPVQIVLQLDGTQVARALFPGPLFTQMLQNKRSLVNLGLS